LLRVKSCNGEAIDFRDLIHENCFLKVLNWKTSSILLISNDNCDGEVLSVVTGD
jgi:hypothetical protein